MSKLQLVVHGRVRDESTGGPPPSHSPGMFRVPVCGIVRYYALKPNEDAQAILDTLDGAVIDKCIMQQDYIHGDGTFRLRALPIPGVVLIRLYTDFAYEKWTYDESDHIGQYSQYVPLSSRGQDDGAPHGVDAGFLTMDGTVGLTDYDSWGQGYHGYQIIHPTRDDEEVHCEFRVQPGASRPIRFVDPNGDPIHGLEVKGLVSNVRKRDGDIDPLAITIKGDQTELVAIATDTPRRIVAASKNGQFYADVQVEHGDLQPLTVQLLPTASVSGRLLHSDGSPMVGYAPMPYYLGGNGWIVGLLFTNISATDEDGRFSIPAMVPMLDASIRFRHSKDDGRPEPVRPVEFYLPRQSRVGERLDLGDLCVDESG